MSTTGEIAKNLIRHVELLSNDGKTLNNYVSSYKDNLDGAVVRNQLVAFVKLLEEMKDYVVKVPESDGAINELKDVLTKETLNLQQALVKATTLEKLTRISAFVILPIVMSVGAAVKFYVSLRQIVSPPPKVQTEKQLPKAQEFNVEELPVVIKQLYTSTQACLTFLDSPGQNKKQLLIKLQDVIQYIKPSIDDAFYGETISQLKIGSMLETVRNIKSSDIEASEAQINILKNVLNSTLKELAFAQHSMANTIVEDLNSPLSSAVPQTATAEEDPEVYMESDEEFNTLGFKHDAIPDAVNASDMSLNETAKASSFLANVQELSMSKNGLHKSDSTQSIKLFGSMPDISPEPLQQGRKYPEKAQNKSPTSPLSSSPLAKQAGTDDEDLKPVRKIYPVSVDIHPPNQSKAKYAVVFEVSMIKTKAEEGTHSLRKSDREVQALVQELTVLYPGLFQPLSTMTNGPPSVLEINKFLQECSVIFAVINTKMDIIKSQPILRFVNEGLHNHADVHVAQIKQSNSIVEEAKPLSKYQTIDKAASDKEAALAKRPQSEVDATFYSPRSNSQSNRFSVFQIDPQEAEKLIHGQSSNMRYRTSSSMSFNRSSKYFGSAKDINSMARSQSSLAETPPEKKDNKSKRGSMMSIMGGSTNETSSPSRASKMFSFMSSSSKASTGSRNSETSKSMVTLGRDSHMEVGKFTQMAKERRLQAGNFLHIGKRLHSLGYKMVNDNQYSLQENDKEIATIVIEQGIPRIVAATPAYLVRAAMLDEPPTDVQYKDCFYLTYRHFMKPHELLIKIIERFKQISTDKSESYEVEQVNLVAFILKWMTISWDDFDRDVNLLSILQKFVEIIKSSKKIAAMASQITVLIDKSKHERARDKEDQAFKQKIAVTGLISNVGSASFVTLDPHQFASQLTRLDVQLSDKIRQVDYVEYIWQKPEQRTSYVNDWISHFNLVSFWIGTEVCTTPILKNRVAVLESAIRVLKCMKDLNNFNGVMAFISGLNMSSIRRLKKTWECVNPKYIAMLHEIEKMMDPHHNYQQYRDIENKLAGQPFVPFIGLYLKDLTFSNDGNPKLQSNGLVNFSKNWSIFEIVKRISVIRECQYSSTEDQHISDYCSKLIALPEKRLYAYSLLCEPRQQEKAQHPQDTRMIEKWSKIN